MKPGNDLTASYLLHSSDEAASAAGILIGGSTPFSLEPFPDDEWRLTIKDALLPDVEGRLGRELWHL
jgi:hypothetical protein